MSAAPRRPANAGRWFTPLGVYMTDDAGECLIRDYAGQSGRFVVYGPYSADVMASFRSQAEAERYIEQRFGPGTWTYRGTA